VSDSASYAVVVLAGGTSRRMGGGDKTALDLGAGRSVLDHLVSGFESSVPVVVVGPRHALERSVRWTRESPPGGGPLAGLAAGCAALLADLPAGPPTDQEGPNGAAGAAGTGPATWVVVVAGDQPFAATAVGPLLTAAAAVGAEVDAVVGRDDTGRLQPLLAAYRSTALRSRLTGAEAKGSQAQPIAGRSMHSLLETLIVQAVPLPEISLLDVDDPASLAIAREAWAAGPGGAG
jgi:molybdopterin-guanine dinucleotide biosynthesis protein A